MKNIFVDKDILVNRLLLTSNTLERSENIMSYTHDFTSWYEQVMDSNRSYNDAVIDRHILKIFNIQILFQVDFNL